MLTVYGIETFIIFAREHSYKTVATVLTVYGIETQRLYGYRSKIRVATVLTVYGIETPLYAPFDDMLMY